MKKAKIKSSVHHATFKEIKKRTRGLKQLKSLKHTKVIQKKQMAVKTPAQKFTQQIPRPAQKFQSMLAPNLKQKKTMNDEAITARLRAITGGK